MKLIVDLIYEGGIANMNYSVSNTAEYGEYVSGPRIVNDATKAEMKRVLDDIQSGRFARDWMLENKVNQASFKAMRRRLAEHPIEQVGEKLRAMMPWIGKNALVDEDAELTRRVVPRRPRIRALAALTARRCSQHADRIHLRGTCCAASRGSRADLRRMERPADRAADAADRPEIERTCSRQPQASPFPPRPTQRDRKFQPARRRATAC